MLSGLADEVGKKIESANAQNLVSGQSTITPYFLPAVWCPISHTAPVLSRADMTSGHVTYLHWGACVSAFEHQG